VFEINEKLRKVDKSLLVSKNYAYFTAKLIVRTGMINAENYSRLLITDDLIFKALINGK